MEEIKKTYKQWRADNDEDYCYDEVGEFINSLSRGDLLQIMDEWSEGVKI
jgi:hypothetical protein